MSICVGRRLQDGSIARIKPVTSRKSCCVQIHPMVHVNITDKVLVKCPEQNIPRTASRRISILRMSASQHISGRMPIQCIFWHETHETPARNTRLQHGISLQRGKLADHWRIRTCVHCRKPRPAQAVKLRHPARRQPRAVPHARHRHHRLHRAVRVDRARRARLVADVALEGAGGARRARVTVLIT